MKKILISTILLLLLVACNAEKTKNISTDAHQQAQATTRSFPQATRSPDEVVCINCRAKFKLARAMHKMKDGHEYIECPICHHDYLKKSH